MITGIRLALLTIKRAMQNLTNRAEAIEAIRKEFELNRERTDSVRLILAECDEHGITLPAQRAYILATAWHESRLLPITEWGSDAYLRSKAYWPYIGRGFVQLTWDYNYRKQGDRMGIDLLGNPELALEKDIAADILVYGMKHGQFTGKKLSDYINSGKTDFPNARRIINGTDKAEMIAGYASRFLKCLK